MRLTTAQQRVLEALAAGKYIHDAGRIQMAARIFPPERGALGVTVPSPTLLRLLRTGMIAKTDNGMVKPTKMPWYARRYDITDAGRAALAEVSA